jgi:type VI secretion system protein ImpB
MNAHFGSPPQHRINITLPGEPDGTRSELPFIIAVLADLSGMPERPLSHIGYRRFVDVDLANLDDVLRACAPHLSLTVANKLALPRKWRRNKHGIT